MHVIPMIITYMLQGTLCDTGIPRTFYGGNICSVHRVLRADDNQNYLNILCITIPWKYFISNPIDNQGQVKGLVSIPVLYTVGF